MTRTEFFVQNYPKRSLNNYSEPYYGYPEKLIREMVALAGDADWKNITIAVMDDFSLELVRYLHFKLNVPFEHINLLVSNYNLKKLCEIQFGIVDIQIYGLDDEMMFDLIIANPPYGNNKGTLPKSILNNCLKKTKLLVYLMPTSYYAGQLTHLKRFNKINKLTSQNIFYASCPPLTIGLFDKGFNSELNDWDWQVPDTELLFALKKYQSTHISLNVARSHILMHSNLHLKDSQSQSAFDPECFKLYDQDFYERSLVFGMYWLSNGVHSDEGDAVDNFWNYKLKDYKDFQEYIISNNKHPDLHALVFKTKQEKINAENWRRNGKFYTRILKELDNGGSIKLIDFVFPHVDWSHPWTDEEILKEIGLPENFLEN